jgi:hypothetical protein
LASLALYTKEIKHRPNQIQFEFQFERMGYFSVDPETTQNIKSCVQEWSGKTRFYSRKIFIEIKKS